MVESATVTIRVNTELKQRLEVVAKRQQRSKSYIAAAALTDYIDVQEAQVAGIEKALGELDRGESIEHNQVLKWVKSWDTDDERPTPLS